MSKMAVAGFAMFSMIFGSGNTAFPIILGKDYTSNYWVVIAGWLLTTVVVPMSGYFGAFLFDGDNKKFLAPIGQRLTFLLMILLMVMAGPFGVVGRGVNVAFGAIHVVAPEMGDVIFNLIYCVITIVLAWHPGKIVQIIGLVFTPLKFGGVALVVIGALYFGGSFSDIPKSTIPVFECFTDSAKTGFQTMDLLAAFLMGSTVFAYIKNAIGENSSKKSFMTFSFGACVVGAIVLTVIYVGLILIGAQYSVALSGTPNESLFTKIALISMGGSASWFVAVIIAVCCLGTNVALSSVFTDFVYKDILKERINRKILLVVTGVATFGASLIGFDEICRILGAVLSAIYPILIIFVVARITYYFSKKMHR